MLLKLFSFFCSLPNFKGKLFLLEQFYRAFFRDTYVMDTQSWTGVKLSLYMEDRIQRRMFIKKSHEYETEIHLLKFAEHANGFLDIGANIGYISLMIAHKFPNLPVYSFEPNPNNLKRIEINIKLNNIQNIKVNNLCISNESSEVTFSVPPENESGWGRMTTASSKSENNFIKVTSKAESLDNLLNKGFFDNNKPDLIKIDIEGSEEKALRGGQEFIKKFKPILCVELNEDCLIACNSSSLQVMNLLHSWGYKAHYIAGQELLPTQVPRENYQYLDYFFLPQ
jgi:FkbM family methyltransferase